MDRRDQVENDPRFESSRIDAAESDVDATVAAIAKFNPFGPLLGCSFSYDDEESVDEGSPVSEPAADLSIEVSADVSIASVETESSFCSHGSDWSLEAHCGSPASWANMADNHGRLWQTAADHVSKSPLEMLLGSLAAGSRVAVLVYPGSFCPFTIGHEMTLVGARQLILDKRGDQYDECIGLIALNSDSHVQKKMARLGCCGMSRVDREHLISLAIPDLDWVEVVPTKINHHITAVLKPMFPTLRFEAWSCFGADLALEKNWNYPSRSVCMGRPGHTKKVMSSIQAQGAQDHHWVLIGPEVPKISSTRVRNLLRQRNAASLAMLLRSNVIDWHFRQSPVFDYTPWPSEM